MYKKTNNNNTHQPFLYLKHLKEKTKYENYDFKANNNQTSPISNLALYTQ